MSEPSEAEVHAATEAIYARLSNEWPESHIEDIARSALRAAAAVRERESVPREPDEDAFSRGVYAVADALCASEYVNAPDASFVLSLAHRAFADGCAAAVPHDPTNPFATRSRPKRSIRLMTDAERRKAGLDPNGGFDGPTGAD